MFSNWWADILPFLISLGDVLGFVKVCADIWKF
jgi:hypothetical protein